MDNDKIAYYVKFLLEYGFDLVESSVSPISMNNSEFKSLYHEFFLILDMGNFVIQYKLCTGSSYMYVTVNDLKSEFIIQMDDNLNYILYISMLDQFIYELSKICDKAKNKGRSQLSKGDMDTISKKLIHKYEKVNQQ